MQCSKCSKDLTFTNSDGGTYSVSAIQVSMRGLADIDAMRMAGKYWKQRELEWNFCLECYLDSLFCVKE